MPADQSEDQAIEMMAKKKGMVNKVCAEFHLNAFSLFQFPFRNCNPLPDVLRSNKVTPAKKNIAWEVKNSMEYTTENSMIQSKDNTCPSKVFSKNKSRFGCT